MRWLPVLLCAPAASGAAAGVACPLPGWMLAGGLLAATVAAILARRARRGGLVLAAAQAGILCAVWAVASQAELRARDPPLARRLAAADANSPVWLQGRLLEDASPGGGGVRLRLEVAAATIISLTVSGSLAHDHRGGWKAGRVLRVPATVRRPGRFLTPGVPDHQLAQARRGLVLVGSVKSGALVEVLAPGSWLAERGASLRGHARRALDEHVGRTRPRAAAIAKAILIGDRAGLEPALIERLQAAGTYHVMAISGGNIAILGAVMLALLWICRVPARAASLVTLVLLIAYGGLVGAQPSVIRATLMASAYLALRVLDLRVSPLNALAAAATAMLLATPLAVRDPGFLLTVGATAALILLTRPLLPAVGPAPLRWTVGLVASSLATELILLPVSALLFNRITAAGLVLNLAAVPLMTVVQVASLLVVGLHAAVPPAAGVAGMAAGAAADALVDSASLLDVAPWLSRRVPSPAWWVLVSYATALAARFGAQHVPGLPGRWRFRLRRAGAATICGAVAWIAVHPGTWDWPWRVDGRLRVTFLDVGQGDSTLVELPTGDRLLVDTGGAGGQSSFDIGARVVAPALWARGIGGLAGLILTHGDPDHVGGAASVLEDFRPPLVWEGVPVPRHQPLRDLRARAQELGAGWHETHAGARWTYGAATVHVWHPPAPDWERPRVRNDDSIVLEIRVGDVSIVLPGDVGADIEAALASAVLPAPLLILKAPHHGSATSSSARVLDALAPTLAIVSCGRENRYGHPAPDVLARYAERGIEVLRTDRDGAITLTTDGRVVEVQSFTGRRLTLESATAKARSREAAKEQKNGD